MRKNRLTENQKAEYARIAYYYYKERATQDQIARRMGISRQRVNRILGECLEQGIVQISIVNQDAGLLELESRLKGKYGLHDIRVVDHSPGDDIYRDLGMSAGSYLASILRDGDVIGFTRGHTLAAMAEYMPRAQRRNLVVVPLMGSRNQEPQKTTANEIVHTFSQKLNASLCHLFAPIILGSPELKRSMHQDPIFRESYEVMRACSISVAGIGTSDSIGLFFNLTGASAAELLDADEGQQVTGEVGTHLYDGQGRPVRNRFRDRVIAIELEDYFPIPVRIGVAGEAFKARAIHAAMLGNYVNVLIVDAETARILETL